MSDESASFVRLARQLGRLAPAIPVRGDNIEILKTPTQFLDALLGGMRCATRRVTVGALYLGSGPGLEAQLLDALSAAAAAQATSGVEINVLYDALRATRPSRDRHGAVSSTAQEGAARVLCALPEGAAKGPPPRVSLYHTPALRGMLKRLLPPRMNEAVGVNHVKAFVFDSDVILSGANLSNQYFSTRQDRYYRFRRSPELADFINAFMCDVLRPASLQLQRNGTLALPELCTPPSAPLLHHLALRHAAPTDAARLGSAAGGAAGAGGSIGAGVERTGDGFAAMSRRQLRALKAGLRARLLSHFAPPPAEQLRLQSGSHDRVRHGSSSGACDNGTCERLDGDTASREDKLAGQAMGDYMGTQCSEHDTLVFPTVQAAAVGVCQDELATLQQLHALEPGDSLHLSSAYLNLVPQYERALAAAQGADITFITAAPQANGFYGAKGLAGAVPDAYALLARQTLRRVQRPSALQLHRPLRRTRGLPWYPVPAGGAGTGPVSPSAAATARWRIRENLLGPYVTHSVAAHSEHKGSTHSGASGHSGPSGAMWLHADRRNAPSGTRNRSSSHAVPGPEGVRSARLLEYMRSGWEYHAKGCWLHCAGERHPVMTTIGSPNLGYRSVHRDLELQVAIVTRSAALRARMQGELDGIMQHCEEVAVPDVRGWDRLGPWQSGAWRKALTPGVAPGFRRVALRAATRLLRGFL